VTEQQEQKHRRQAFHELGLDDRSMLEGVDLLEGAQGAQALEHLENADDSDAGILHDTKGVDDLEQELRRKDAPDVHHKRPCQIPPGNPGQVELLLPHALARQPPVAREEAGDEVHGQDGICQAGQDDNPHRQRPHVKGDGIQLDQESVDGSEVRSHFDEDPRVLVA